MFVGAYIFLRCSEKNCCKKKNKNTLVYTIFYIYIYLARLCTRIYFSLTVFEEFWHVYTKRYQAIPPQHSDFIIRNDSCPAQLVVLSYQCFQSFMKLCLCDGGVFLSNRSSSSVSNRSLLCNV